MDYGEDLSMETTTQYFNIYNLYYVPLNTGNIFKNLQL